jgi:ABC-2 type transport system permease protein
MIKSQVALLRRELWEHRAIFVVPLVVAVVMVLTSLTGQVSVNDLKAIDMGIVGASNMPENARSLALSGILVGLSSPFVFAMWILTIFYSLDSLYAERKDRSILFWRSIPCTDFETVLSKLVTAVLVIPLVTFVIIIATHLLVLLNISIWIDFRGGSPWHLIWSAVPFADNWTATFVMLLALPLWLSPFIGWFLFVSAFTKRSPLLIAASPIVLLPLLEKILFGSSVVAETLFVRSVNMPLFAGLDNMDLLFQGEDHLEKLANAKLSLLSLMDLGGFLSNLQLWLGLVVCGLFSAAAIYVRRYRDES